ncbi:MAG: hypothetical protein KGK10_00150 [Rhodospirillales bacterium]|nr:hypothetical protein [Rhodospirillales bacterium]
MSPSPRHAPLGETNLPDRLAETAVIAAWLAVPLFALLAAGRVAAPLHAAGIATLMTLALRLWRSTRRGQALDEIRQHLAAYLDPPLLRPAVFTQPPRPHRRLVERPRLLPVLLAGEGRNGAADGPSHRG